VDNVSLPFFNHAMQKFKVRPVSPDCRFEADWLKCAAPQTTRVGTLIVATPL